MSPATTSRPLHSLLSTLSLRHPASQTTLKPTSYRGQVRTQATARRATKRLRVHPTRTAPRPHPGAVTHLPPSSRHTPAGTVNKALQAHQALRQLQRPIDPLGSRITFAPPPSAPTPYHTPGIFLPPNDPRARTLALSHKAANPYAEDPERRLPPPVRKPYEKKYQLTQEQIAEMRELRLSDPVKWTRQALAVKFGCTPFFAGIAAPSELKRREWHRENLEKCKENWGPRRTKAREDRVRRRELWARDA